MTDAATRWQRFKCWLGWHGRMLYYGDIFVGGVYYEQYTCWRCKKLSRRKAQLPDDQKKAL